MPSMCGAGTSVLADKEREPREVKGILMRSPAGPSLAACLVTAVSVGLAAGSGPRPLAADAARWVDRSLAAMSLDDKAAQLVFPGLDSTFLSTDSDTFERLRELAETWHVGGFLVFGGSEPVPGVLLNPTYGSVILGDPLSAAATLNRLQRVSPLPLLNAGDFEWGVGMRIRGATQFPRAMGSRRTIAC